MLREKQAFHPEQCLWELVTDHNGQSSWVLNPLGYPGRNLLRPIC